MTAPEGFPPPAEFGTGGFNDFESFARALDRDQFAGPALRGGIPRVMVRPALPTASVETRGRFVLVPGDAGVADACWVCTKDAANAYAWVRLDNITTAAIQALIDATTLGGELGGTVASATVDATHSGSSHAGVIATHEAAGDPHTGYMLEAASAGGELGNTNASPTVDTIHSGSKHAVISRIFDATEHTTTSTSAVTLVDLSGLSIPVTSGLIIKGSVRKTTGHASRCALGLGINATVVGEAQTAVAVNAVWRSGNLSAAENGTFSIEIGPRDANYLHSIIGQCFAPPNEDPRFSYLINTADLPNATITDVLIRGICDNALNTLAIKNVAVFEVIY